MARPMTDRHGIGDSSARMTATGPRDPGSTGRLIREHRKRRGLTQPQLAKLVGAGERTVQAWEAGAPVARAWRQQLATVLDCDAGELFDGQPEPRDRQAAAAAARAGAYRRNVIRTSQLRGRTPGERLLELLAQERAHGVRFDVAWPPCMRLAFFRLHQLGLMTDTDERRAWRQALGETRAAWQRAYEGAPAVIGEDFAARLVA
jgi:transcriptional regulator with XRE-family HTH domain